MRFRIQNDLIVKVNKPQHQQHQQRSGREAYDEEMANVVEVQ